MSIPAYPLQWPDGWKRTLPVHRTRARFGKASRKDYAGNWSPGRSLTIAEALGRLQREIAALAKNDDFVISTNLQMRLDGLPRSGQSEPTDPGAAVYWRDASQEGLPQRCMAIDIYDRVADNIAAIAATLDAMRAIERHGGAEILNRAFTGFVALEHHGESWWDVLEVPRDSTRDVIDASYQRKRSEHHPDKGGDPNQFQRVQRAYEAATRGI